MYKGSIRMPQNQRLYTLMLALVHCSLLLVPTTILLYCMAEIYMHSHIAICVIMSSSTRRDQVV